MKRGYGCRTWTSGYGFVWYNFVVGRCEKSKWYVSGGNIWFLGLVNALKRKDFHQIPHVER